MRFRSMHLLTALFLFATLVACSSQPASDPPSVDMTGVWSGTVQARQFGLEEDGRFRLAQSGADVTGTVETPIAYLGYVTVGDVTGTVAGNRVDLTLTFDPSYGYPGGGDLSGTVTTTPDGERFSGSGRLRSGGRSGNVTFSAVRQ